MGSGCTGQGSTSENDRVRLYRQGNLTFYIYGIFYTENAVSGKGCRKTVSWHTNFSKEEIDAKIKEFWETRVEGNEIVWSVLKQACEEPDPTAIEKQLQKYGITMPNGLLQQTYDERGQRYDLPPFIINPAIKYGVSKNTAEIAQFNAQLIKVMVRGTKFADVQLEINSGSVGAEVKKKIISELDLIKPIRLFYAGKEIADGVPIGNYSVKNQSTLQVFCLS